MKRILIVDDDEGILDTLAILLKKNGFQVDSEINGTNLLRKKIFPVPDLILLDVFISGVDGKEICRYIRNDPAMMNVPIIMMSASYNVAQSSLDSGATTFLEKPFDIKDLLQKVNTCLDQPAEQYEWANKQAISD